MPHPRQSQSGTVVPPHCRRANDSPISNSLDHFNKKLKKVLFYDGLGSIFDKTIRLAKISDFFASFFNLDPSLAKEAALLSKADLASEMVGEFPELQGIMGGYYSKINGTIPDVSIAISEHYKPKGLSDELPKSNLGAMLSVIDNIAATLSLPPLLHSRRPA